MKVQFDARWWSKYLIPEVLYRGYGFETWKWTCWIIEVQNERW